MRIIPANPDQPIYLGPDFCHCGTRTQETGCSAPPCIGLRCPDCEYGCDIDSRPDSGECATAIDVARKSSAVTT